MANFPIENFYTGYHVTSGLYSTGYADGSLQATIQGQLGCQPGPQIASPGASYWQSLMSTQQGLYGGWNDFCGCSGKRPQPQQAPQQPPRHGEGCGRKRVDIHVYHHFYKNGCGGPFTSNQGQGASSTSQNYGAFGSYGSCGGWQNNSSQSYYTPFNSCNNFGLGNMSLSAYASNLASYNSYQGYQGGCGSSYGGYQGGYGGSYGGSYGGYGGSYGGSYGGGYGTSGSPGCYGSYGSNSGAPNFNINNTYGVPQTLPSYNWGDFKYSFGRDKNSAFGVLPSAYASYAMTSPFTSGGTAMSIAAVGGALSLLF